MKKLLFALALLLTPASAWAQCNGVFANNTVCGNATGGSNLPRPTNPSAFIGTAGGTNGQIQYNNAGVLGGLTDPQVTARIGVATTALSGAVPAWPNNTTTFYRGDGTYATPNTVTSGAPGYAPAFPNNTTTSFLGNGTYGSAVSNNYTASYTGGAAYTIQQRFDDGILFASDYGVTCDGTTNDATNMDKFLAAVAVSKSKIGIVTGSSATAVCNMATSQFLPRAGTDIRCSRGVTLKFATNGALVAPYNSHVTRTFFGKFEGCTIDGTSSVTYASSTGVSLYDASDWVVRDTFITNVNIGLALEGGTASYYNRIENVVASNIRSYAFYLDPVANSNTLVGIRGTSVGLYGVYCRANQNTFVGLQIESGFSAAFTTDSGCSYSTITGFRIEGGAAGVQVVAGANYNTFVGLYCSGLSGTPYSDAGTGTVKTGGSC